MISYVCMDSSHAPFYKAVPHACMRRECPHCKDKLAWREGHDAEERLRYGAEIYQIPISYCRHVVLSPCLGTLDHGNMTPDFNTFISLGYHVENWNIHKGDRLPQSQDELDRLYILAREALNHAINKEHQDKVCPRGGVILFHAQRYDEDTEDWYDGPHFHVFYFGFVDLVENDACPEESVVASKNRNLLANWIIKVIPPKGDRSLAGSIKYAYDHASFNRKNEHHIARWIGAWSYNLFDLSSTSESSLLFANADDTKCPLCGKQMMPVLVSDFVARDAIPLIP